MTAANSSSISDGAAALVLMRRSTAEKRGLTPLATIVGHATHAQEPGWFTTAPVGAIRKLFERPAGRAGKVDLYEINEAFAVVTMAAMQEHGLPHDKVNVHGGACALGHPIGASGARILVTLIGALRKYGGKRGVASAVHRRRRSHRHGDRTRVSEKATSAQLQTLLKRSRFVSGYGLRLVSVDDDECTIAMPFRRALERPGRHGERPGVHGGGRLRHVAGDQAPHRHRARRRHLRAEHGVPERRAPARRCTAPRAS